MSLQALITHPRLTWSKAIQDNPNEENYCCHFIPGVLCVAATVQFQPAVESNKTQADNSYWT
jgi:hypothetical protein